MYNNTKYLMVDAKEMYKIYRIKGKKLTGNKSLFYKETDLTKINDMFNNCNIPECYQKIIIKLYDFEIPTKTYKINACEFISNYPFSITFKRNNKGYGICGFPQEKELEEIYNNVLIKKIEKQIDLNEINAFFSEIAQKDLNKNYILLLNTLFDIHIPLKSLTDIINEENICYTLKKN